MEESQYRKGYVAGYRDGLKAAAQGKTEENPLGDIPDLPIDRMAISARARNCLIHAGCHYTSDLVKLRDERIATMRNLGPKSAAEIAQWLDQHGIHYSAWCTYL